MGSQQDQGVFTDASVRRLRTADGVKQRFPMVGKGKDKGESVTWPTSR